MRAVIKLGPGHKPQPSDHHQNSTPARPDINCVLIGPSDICSGSYILRMPQHRTALLDKSFRVMAYKLWNALLQTITSIDNRSRLVAKLKDVYLKRLAGADSV
ncbi:hypothetical protein J6590_001289 [Homalodisca vitripennis]|nr:hypothetical protein J6590_001289 [Homalodisca vitripennis]